MILLIDNYDSFTFNLQRYLIRLGEQVCVIRNDDLRLAEALAGDTRVLTQPWIELPGSPQALVVSPGPKRPSDAGFCLELVRRMSGVLPILGICLGHQIICEALGGAIVRARQPIHGRATPIQLGDSPLFDGLCSRPGQKTVEFARYHSLVAEQASLPNCLRVTARSDDGQIMAVEHRQHATYGIQFHPESILSLQGYRLLQNFLSLAGRGVRQPAPASDLVNAEQLIDWRHTAATMVGEAAVSEISGEVEAEHTVVHPRLFGAQRSTSQDSPE